jgi:glycosyltransferase involved in cell wall biosynthesis
MSPASSRQLRVICRTVEHGEAEMGPVVRGIRKGWFLLRHYLRGAAGKSMAPDPWSDTLIVLEIPALPDAVYFRAYEEDVGGGPILRWAVRRLRVATDGKSDLVVVAPTSDASRVHRAVGEQPGVSLRHSATAGRLRDLQMLARHGSSKRLLLVDTTAALLPSGVFQGLLTEHLSNGNHATTLVGQPCAAPPVIIEAALLRMLARGIPGLPKDVVPRDVRQAIDALARAVQLLGKADRVRFGTLLGLTPEEQTSRKWPFRVLLREPDEIAVLREVLLTPAGLGDVHREDVEPLDMWVEAWSRCRERRIAKLWRGVRRPRFPRARSCVLQVQAPSGFSGAEEVVVLLAEGLHHHPAEFECVALVGLAGFFAERLARSGVGVRIANRDFARSSVENYLYSNGVLDAVDPTIVHGHSITGSPFCCAIAARGIPYVQHVHVASEEELTVLADQIAFATAVITPSEFVKRRVMRLGTSPEKIYVIHNGVRTARTEPPNSQARPEARRAVGVPDDAHVVLVAARLAPNKRHDRALESFALLQSRVPNAYLVLAGEASPGDEPVVADLDARTLRLGLQERVRRLGFWRDMAGLYAAADVVLLPSENEPLGLAVLEAMAVGVPVVGARSGGIPEMIIPGVSGLLVEPSDVGGFAAALHQVLADDEFRGRLVEGGRIRVEREFSVWRFVEQVRDLYRVILADAGNAQVGNGGARA